jgi:hypothetical protein
LAGFYVSPAIRHHGKRHRVTVTVMAAGRHCEGIMQVRGAGVGRHRRRRRRHHRLQRRRRRRHHRLQRRRRRLLPHTNGEEEALLGAIKRYT